jgi:hypothetical protein
MSADSTSTEKPAGAEDPSPEQIVDSADQSLLAIMKEVQQADGPAAEAKDDAAPQTVEPVTDPPVEVLGADVPGVDAALPDAAPVILAAETRDAAQTAESAAWETDASAQPSTEVEESAADAMEVASTSGEEQTANPPFDDTGAELSEGVEPSIPGVELSIDELEAEAVVESILATARTTHHDAEQTLGAAPVNEEDAPPSDEVLLANIVLPAGFGASSSSAAAESPRRTPSAFDIGEDDRTTISALPPDIEPQPTRLPAPGLAASDRGRRVTPTWPGTETVNPSLQQFGRLPRPPMRGWVRVARQVASHRVNATVAQLALVVVSATAFGAAAVRLMGPTASASTGAAAATVPERLDDARFKPLPPRPPEIAPLPPTAVETVEPAQPIEPEEKPKARSGRKHLARSSTTSVTGDATGERGGEVAADPPSQAAVTKKSAPARPRPRHVAQQGGAWVDPFGD